VADLRFRWNGSDLIPADGAPILPLYVADSWLLVDGGVVELQKHFERFAESATAQGLVRPVDAFTAAVTAKLPRTGSWFPRIDLTERGELELWVRPAPKLGETVILATAPSDVRTEPTVKGPDIPALEELRQQARTLGADDAVILNAAGQIIDGATTCLLWWRDGDVFIPPTEARRVDSITVKVARDIAAAHGVAVAEEWATPLQLGGATVWALNSLHGIRQVTSWIDGADLISDLPLLSSWRADYKSRSASLTVI
jgi:branched-subunit amino acid aminotransferase/4-amino-4-deoxychorismate lyase